jgi:hypothetical protein
MGGPDPRFWELERAGLTPEQVVMVKDLYTRTGRRLDCSELAALRDVATLPAMESYTMHRQYQRRLQAR